MSPLHAAPGTPHVPTTSVCPGSRPIVQFAANRGARLPREISLKAAEASSARGARPREKGAQAATPAGSGGRGCGPGAAESKAPSRATESTKPVVVAAPSVARLGTTSLPAPPLMDTAVVEPSV